MKHSLFIKVFFLTVFGLIYQSTKSDVNGKFNGGTSCASCHGAGSTNTVVAITGLPTAFETNKTYSLTFTVTNPTNLKAGFNILVSSGILTAGTGSKVNAAKTQITHTAPMVSAGTTASFSFTWKAPATRNNVTFSAVGNAVNGNTQEDLGDQWAAITISIGGTFPTGITSAKSLQLKCYPNPVSGKLIVNGDFNEEFGIKITDIYGKIYTPNCTSEGDKWTVDCSEITPGIYFVLAENGVEKYMAKFVKL